MDAVNAFNHELFSLMDAKPPISRAKMISITKSAIKAMKLYKHVVQIVEKFIKKCKPEYKVAGLYVVDSIVRQSRHQFGADKDVFGPRFTKNITGTFENLCLCPLEDRSKIVRVLNLWQKNGVFKIEVIQPLLDMAAANSSAALSYTGPDEPDSPPLDKEPIPPVTVNSSLTSATQLQNSDAFAAVAQLFQSTQGQQLQQMLQNFQQQPVKPETNTQPLPNIQPQGHITSSSLGPTPQQPPLLSQSAQHKSAFDKTLLDRFDYDDEPEGGEETKKDETSSQHSFMQQPSALPHLPEHFNKPQMMSQDLSQQVPLPPNGQPQAYGLPPGQVFPVGGVIPPMGHPQLTQHLPGSTGFQGAFPPHNAVPQQQDSSTDIDHSSVRDGRPSHRSHSGSRSPKRRRSRSNSRTRRGRHRRSRSRSRERRHHSPRSRSHERRERERERERRQRGLPPLKNDTLSVCSTTLWVGQLDKRTQQQDVACLLEEFGQIESVNMIPPRGCAYIVMVHRQDAFRALQKLSRGTYKVNQKIIKIAWALNKGIKSEYKQYWDVELGVTYIPWSKVREEQLEELKDGGVLDIDSLAPEWSTTRQALENSEKVTLNGGTEPQPDEIQVVPVITPAVPTTQVPSAHHPVVVLGTVQPPIFPMGMPLPSFPSGVPPPFLRPGFNPLQMPPGFIPHGAMPLGLPPSKPNNLLLDPAGLGNRKNEDIPDGPAIFNHQMGPLGNQVIRPLSGLPGAPPGGPLVGPPVGLPGALPGGLLGAPPGGLLGAPPGAPLGGLPGAPPRGLPGGPLVGLPGAPPGGLPGAPPGGLPGAPPGGLHCAPPGGLHGAPPGGLHGAPPGGLHGGPPGYRPSAPPGGPLGGPLAGLQGVPPGAHPGAPLGTPPGGLPTGPPSGPPGNMLPTGGLLGARPGLIPLQRPPGLQPNMQRFPSPQGPRPPHPSGPAMPPQMIHRGPNPQVHADPPANPGFGIPPPHNIRGAFPPQGHGPPPQGPPSPFIRPGGPHGDPHRGMESPEQMDERHFRGERPGFRDREPERDWDRDRERDRDRGFSGRRSFGDGGRGDRMDGRDRLSDRMDGRDRLSDRMEGRDRLSDRMEGRDRLSDRMEGRDRLSDRMEGRDRLGDRVDGRDKVSDRMDGRDRLADRMDGRERQADRMDGRDRQADRMDGRDRQTDRMDGRDRLSGWQEDGDHRGGGWERDRGRERDRDRDRRDWRDRRSSLDHDRDRGDRGRGEDGERERRDRGRGEGRDRERGRTAESKDGDRPRRSERRERTTRWDSDDRLMEVDNMDRTRTSDSRPPGRDKGGSIDPPPKKAQSEPLAPKVEDMKTSDVPEPGQSKVSEEKQETAS